MLLTWNLGMQRMCQLQVAILLKDGLIRAVSIVLLVVGVLIGVAFFTLLERYILGYIQERRGPNKAKTNLLWSSES